MQKPLLQQHNKVLDSLTALFLFCLPIFGGKIITDQLSWYQGTYLNYFQLRITLHFIIGFVLLIFAYKYNQVIQISRKLQALLYVSCVLFLLYNALILSQNHDALFILTSTYKLLELFVCTIALLYSLRLFIISTMSVPKTANFPMIIAAITASSTFQGILVMLQLVTSKPVLPNILYLLGEPKTFVSFTYVGINILSRGYGTTPHPNILGGIMLLYVIIILSSTVFSEKIGKKLLLSMIPISVLVMTFSRSAMLGLAIVLLTYFCLPYLLKSTRISTLIGAVMRMKVASALIVVLGVLLGTSALLLLESSIPSLPSFFATRIQLIHSYISIILSKPLPEILFGSGFLTSIPGLIQHASNVPVSLLFNGTFLIEPPHNSLILLVNEFGVLGTITLLLGASFIIQKMIFSFAYQESDTSKKEIPRVLTFGISLLLAVTIIVLLDHYLIY